MRIVIGIDGSAASRTACELVATRSWPVGSRVRLVAIVEPPAPWIGLAAGNRDGTAAREDELAVILDDRADLLRRQGLTCELVIEVGRPSEVLLSHAAEWFADLVVVGSRRLGPAASAVLGSVSAYLVDHAPCPVLVARSPRIERMLLATDGSPSCLGIPRELAAWRPAFRGVDVEVVSIVSGATSALREPEVVARRRVADEMAGEMTELGWRAVALTRAGDPARGIVEAAERWPADLIVTGSRGLGTLQRLVAGSVAHAVLLHTQASMLVMRGGVASAIPARQRAAIAFS